MKHTEVGGGDHSSLGPKATMFDMSKRGYLRSEATQGGQMVSILI